MLGFLQGLADRAFSPFGGRRDFDASSVDATVRLLNANTAGFVAILDGRKPQNPWTVAGDTTYSDAGSIGDMPTVLRLLGYFGQIRTLEDSGELAKVSPEARSELREGLIAAMEDVRLAAIRKRRRL